MAYVIDLFCGAGGMSEGLIQAGFHILFSSDISADVQKTYMNRHEQLGLNQGYNTYFHKGDIRELTGGFIWDCIRNLRIFTDGIKEMPAQIDAVFGGPPCQGFSRAGQRKQDDPRNLLFREYLRIIDELQPKYVVMENVEGFNDTKFYKFKGVTDILYEDGLNAPEILLKEFALLGYDVLQPEILDASDFGVPQRRRRAIFMAYLKNEPKPSYPVSFITDETRVGVQQAIGDLIRDASILERDNPAITAYQKESIAGRTPNINGVPISYRGEFMNNEISRHQKIIVERFSLFREGEDGNALRKRICSEGINLELNIHLLQECSKKLGLPEKEIITKFLRGDVTSDMLDALLTKKTIRTKLCRNKPSLTVVTLPDDYISPFENRTLTVREMARLQSFDDSFEFLSKRTTGGSRRKVEVPQYTQVGNAVPPLLARAIAKEIMEAIKKGAD